MTTTPGTHRTHDWPERLAAFLGRNVSFEERNCGNFVADAIEAMTGLQIERPQLPARHAAERIAKQHGFTRIPIRLAGRGDVVLSRQQQLLLVNLNGDPVGPGDAGLERVPWTEIRRAYRI